MDRVDQHEVGVVGEPPVDARCRDRAEEVELHETEESQETVKFARELAFRSPRDRLDDLECRPEDFHATVGEGEFDHAHGDREEFPHALTEERFELGLGGRDEAAYDEDSEPYSGRRPRLAALVLLGAENEVAEPGALLVP